MVVLKEWVHALPYKAQSVLLSGLRGPDTHAAPKVKAVVRWIRGITQHDADGRGSYMSCADPLPTWKEVEKELEYCSVHYYQHLLHALIIVATGHPDGDVSETAAGFYESMANYLHLYPESGEDMLRRLG